MVITLTTIYEMLEDGRYPREIIELLVSDYGWPRKQASDIVTDLDGQLWGALTGMAPRSGSLVEEGNENHQQPGR